MSRLATVPFPRNVSGPERILRSTLGVILLLLPATGVLEGTLATSALLFAWVPLVTGATGWCPLYTILGVHSRHE
jgi:hypothetical protein